MPATFPCPHCRAPVASAPDLIGQTVLCPACKQPFVLSAAGPSLVPVAPPVSPAPSMIEEAAVERPRYRPRFWPRRYTALRIVQCFFYVDAALLIALAIVAEVLVVGSGAATAAATSRDDLGPGGWLMMAVAAQGMILVWLVLPAIFSLAFGQLIGLAIDVQANTEEAAHHLRHLDRR